MNGESLRIALAPEGALEVLPCLDELAHHLHFSRSQTFSVERHSHRPELGELRADVLGRSRMRGAAVLLRVEGARADCADKGGNDESLWICHRCLEGELH